ncbi:MAG TPA: DeoR/GlpR family DNA-binding transcription regulator [Puia sp.]|nr:DeoR/GlpR family DNA-binding transcription regulator [Puia sp.]
MLRKERLRLILKEINLHNKVLSGDLSEKLSVSEDTIRRDLHELAEEGVILKVHGGAVSKAFNYPFDGDNKVYALKAKQQIAEKAIRLFKNDMSILMEGGTTIIEIAKMIPPNLRATFFTVSPQVALTLAEHENIEVISIGGKLGRNANIHTGASVINELAGIRVDLCIMGANGISMKDGLTDSDWEIVQVIKAMLRSAKKTAVVSIAEKLSTVQKIKICEFGFINYLITELPPGNARLSPYKSSQLVKL